MLLLHNLVTPISPSIRHRISRAIAHSKRLIKTFLTAPQSLESGGWSWSYGGCCVEVVQLEEGCTDKPISQATLIPFTSNFLRYQGMDLAFPNAVQSSGSVPISSPYGDNRVFQYPNVSPPISRQPLHLQPRMQCLSMQITSVILTTPQASLLDQYCRRYRTFKLFMLFCSIFAISRRPRGQSSRFFFPLAALDNTFPTSPHSSRHDP